MYHELDARLLLGHSSSSSARSTRCFGLKNIADAAPAPAPACPQLSAEYVVASSPDLIVLADSRCCGQTRATVAARPGWSTIAAVKNGRDRRIDDSIASRWGPRLVNYVNARLERAEDDGSR